MADEYAIADAGFVSEAEAEAEAESDSVWPLRWCEPLLARGLPNEALFEGLQLLALFDGELHALFDGVLALLALFDELLLELIAPPAGDTCG